MSCPCISNQIFSTASMAISVGLPSIGIRLGNLLNKIEAKNKQKIENLQKINNNINPNNGNKGPNTGNNNSSGGNNSSNGGINGANIGNNGGNNNSNKGNNGSNNNKLNKIIKNIPQRLRLKNEGGKININLFTIKLKGKKWYKEKGGYIIDKDTAGHIGKEWKLRDKKGNRICSIVSDGKIVSK